MYAGQCFSRLKMHQEHEASPAVSDSAGLKWGPRICSSKKFQGAADAAVREHTLGITEVDQSY